MTVLKFNNLMQRKLNGDNEAVKEIFNEFFIFIKIAAFQSIHDWNKAEDITSMVFVKIIEMKNIPYVSEPKAWLRSIAMNTAKDYLKKENRYILCGDDELKKIEDKPLNLDNKLHVYDLISTLTQLEQDIIIEHVIYGYKFREIAKDKNMSPNTVRWIYAEIKKKLQEKL